VCRWNEGRFRNVHQMIERHNELRIDELDAKKNRHIPRKTKIFDSKSNELYNIPNVLAHNFPGFL